MCVTQVWGADETVTYTVATTTSVTSKGTTPSGSSASYAQDYSTKSQMTQASPNASLTLLGYDGCKITGIKLNLKNSNSKKVTVTVKVGSTTIVNAAQISLSTTATDKALTLSSKPIVGTDETVSISMTASGSSVWFYNAKVTYTPKPTTSTSITLSEAGEETNVSGTHYVGDSYTLPSTTSASCGSKVLVGWSTVEIVTPRVKPNSNYYDKGATVTLGATNKFYAVFATASAGGAETWVEITSAPDAGTYAILCDSYFMKAGVTSSRFQNGSATPSITDGKLNSAPAEDCQWEISKPDSYYRIKNGTNYAGATGSKNQGALITDASDDKAKWSISYVTDHYEIINYARSIAQSDSGNKYLRNNTTNGWATYASGTGSAPRLFKKTGGSTYTDYITECCTPLAAPTNLQSSPTGTGGTISWNAVDHASGYEVKIDGGEWTSTGTNTSYTITGKGCGGTEVTWQVRATGSGSYCAEGAACAEQQFNTASCACGEYSFHYKNNETQWNMENICFHHVDGDTYLTDEFAIPVGVSFKVGWKGGDHWDNAKTSETDFYYMMGGNERKWSFGNHPYVGYIAGALGYMRVYGNSGENNKFVGFIPSGYTVNLGTGDNNSNWNNGRTIVLSGKTSAYDENEWYSELTTLTADEIGKKLYVGLKTSTGGVWFAKSVAENLTGLRMKNGADSWVYGGMAAAHAGQKGKFRIYANSTDKNLYVTFVPYWQASFDANGGSEVSAVLPASPVSCEEKAANRTIVLPNSTKTGYSLKWIDQNSGVHNAGENVVLTSDMSFTAQWTAATYTITYKDKDNAEFSGTSWTSSQPTTHTYGLATELVKPRKDNYRFDGWFTTSACTGEPITSLGATAFTTNITLYAKWTRVYAITFSEKGVVNGTLTQYKAIGENVELPNVYIDCNDYQNFEGWVKSTVAEQRGKAGLTIYTGTYQVDGAQEFKALYYRTDGGTQIFRDTLTSGINGGNSRYTNFENKSYRSNAKYAGCTAEYNSSQIQINTTSPQGIVSTTSSGKIVSVLVSWTYQAAANKDMDVYAKSTAYEGSADLYDDGKKGTKVKTFTNPEKAAVDQRYDFTDDYEYIGFKVADGAAYFSKIVIVWELATKYYATNPSCVTPEDYTITYNVNSANGGNSAADFLDTKAWNVGTTIKAIGDCAGFAASGDRGEFVGWNTAADGSGTSYTVGSPIQNRNLTLYAQWEDHYYVNFYDGNHNTPSASIEAIRQTTAGQTIDLSDVNGRLACGSYNFVGWATNADVYNDNMVAIPNIVTEVTPTDADINVYALYSKDAVSPEFTENCAGGNYTITARDNTTMCDELNNSNQLYTYEWWHDTKGNNCGTTFAVTKIGNNLYKILKSDSKCLRATSNSQLEWSSATPDDAAWWTVSTGKNGSWRFTNYSYTDYALAKNGNYYQMTHNSSITGDKYDLELTPAGGAASYNSNPNCAPYQITFVTNGGTMTTPTGLTLNRNGNQYETDDITAGTVTNFNLTAASYPGWTFEGWKKNSAQEDVTSRPGLLLSVGDAESVNNTTTYYAVYSKLDDDKPFDPDVEGTYNVYAITEGGEKLFVPAFTPDNSGRTMSSVTTCTAAGDVTITPGTGVHAGQYQITMGGQKMGAEANDTGLKKDADAWWTITESRHGKGTYRIALVGNESRAWSLLSSNFGHYATSELNNPGQTMYRDVEIGICQEMHYTSTPVQIPTITLRGAPMVTSYKDKGIQATEKILVTASNFSANQTLYVTFDNADVKVLTGGSTGVTKSGENYYFQVDGTGRLENKELTIVYTPSKFGDGSINTVTITVADNADPAATENKATRNTIKIRNLWEKFVIATKVDGAWYALPSMTNRYTNPDAVKVTVSGQTATVPTPISNTHAWGLDVTGQATNKNTLEFVSVLETKYVKTNESSATTIGAYAVQSGAQQNYTEFLPVTTDLTNYQLKNTAYPSTFLSVDGEKKWGVYSEEATVQFFEYATAPLHTLTLIKGEGDCRQVIENIPEGSVVDIVLENACIPAGYHFVSWTVDAGGVTLDDATANPTSFTMGTENVTITARFIGDLTVAGDVRLTSGMKTDLSGGIKVYSTTGAGNLITLSSLDLTAATKLRITYWTEDGSAKITNSNCKFRVCDPGSYTVADATQIDLSGVTTNYSQSFSISYTPSEANAMDACRIRFEATDGSNPLSMVEKVVYGRSLPSQFAIVMKNDGDNNWYALPNDLDVSTNVAASTKAPIIVMVDNETTPTKVTLGTNDILYKTSDRYKNPDNNKGAIRFLKNGATENAWITTSATSQLYMPNNGSFKQNFYLNSSNFSDYLITQDSAVGYRISMYGGTIGWYNTGTNDKVYLLPVETILTPKEADVIEWGANGLVAEVDATGVVGMIATVGATSTGKLAMTQTTTSAGSATKYDYTFNFGGLILTDKANQVMKLDWVNSGGVVIGSTLVKIPRIISGNVTRTTEGQTKTVWENYDEVVVLPGAKLTVDDGAQITLKKVSVYPGGKLNITGNAQTNTLILRAGWSSNKQWAMPNVAIADAATLTKTNAYLDWYVDYHEYYPIAVPFPVTVDNMSYVNTKSSAASGVTFKQYDGQQRAEQGQASVGQNWKQSSLDTLKPSTGYAMTARRPSGKAWSIVRMPLSFANDWTTNGEKGAVNAVTKNVVGVTAYGVGGAQPWYCQGWNFVANPYMVSFNSNAEGLTGKLAFQNGGDVKFATIPDINFEGYDQLPIASANLQPMSGFFVQVANTGNIEFVAAGKQLMAAPMLAARTAEEPKGLSAEGYIKVSGNGQTDMFGLLVADEYTAGNDFNADLPKLLGDNKLRAYMVYNGQNMAYVALNETLAAEWIPITVRVPQQGGYEFALDENISEVEELEGLYLFDALPGTTTNLLNGSYAFEAEAGSLSDRFALNAVRRAPQVPTDISGGGGDGGGRDIRKVIFNDKLYIIVDGKVFDATGKTVK